MKLYHSMALLALIAGIMLWPAQQARAQDDTLVVEWLMPDGFTMKMNSLYDAFVGDTINRPDGRVYKLRRGGYYSILETITNTRPLRIVGETPGATIDEAPAVLQIYRRGDNTVTGRMIGVNHDLLLKNLWITGADNIGTQGIAYQPIQIDGSNHTIIVDNCVIDRSNFSVIAFQNGAHNKAYFTNNKFRNLIGRPSTQQWEGRGISVWADQDTVILENNTFFNMECFPFQMENGAAAYVRFNHNTVVNVGRNISGNWWREAYFTNNLLINPFFQGEGVADYGSSGRDARSNQSGWWNIGSLPSSYGPEQGRRLLFGFNTAWRDPQFTTWYADTIRPQAFIGDVTCLDYLSGQYETMKARDTVWLVSRPNMPTYPDSQLAKMWANIIDLRRAQTPATPWFFNLPLQPPEDTSACHTCIDWPLPENFSYTTPANLLTAGTDHLPLGDLNWFPTAKTQFEANKQAYIDTLQTYAGVPPIFVPVARYEAENGALAGDAAIQTSQGFTYYQMDGGGFLEWSFNLPTAGQYDLGLWVNMRGNTQKGQHTIINGTEIHDHRGWGELIFDAQTFPNFTANDWVWFKVIQDSINEAGALTLPAGTTTVRISASWGWMNFAGIYLMPAGTSDTTVKKLGSDVTNYNVVVPHLEPSTPFVPAYFKSVLLNTNGTITWNINPDSSGQYSLQIFYQNYDALKTVSIALDGSTVVPSVNLPVKADSTSTSVLSPYFPVVAGPHTLTLSGAPVNVDFVQLTRVIPQGPVSVSPDGLPLTYSLDQNYPNPFNPSTQINFSLAKVSNVKLVIYNVLGQQVTTLIDTRMDAGPHTVRFDARNLASGVYFYRLDAGDFKANKKMLLLK